MSEHQKYAKHLVSRENNMYIYIYSSLVSAASVIWRGLCWLFYRWIGPCSMCASMLKNASGFSMECIIFASFILISVCWSPDYTVSFRYKSCWSLQKIKKKKILKCSTVVLLFCGDRKDAAACRFILMWYIIAQKLFLKPRWKKSQGWHREAVIWETCLGCMQGK